MSETEYIKKRESLAPVVQDFLSLKPSEVNPREKSPAGMLLQDFLKVINSTDEEAKERYNQILNELQKRAEDVIIEIARAEQQCSRNDFSTRWALIFAASELNHPAALPLLKNVVLTPIPPERSHDPHSFSTVEEETIIRTTAVDGVRHLAENGDENALETLLEFLEIPSVSIRRASVQAIFSARKDDKMKREVEEILPKNMRFLVHLKPTTVQETRQIENPQNYLAKPERDTKKMPAPKIHYDAEEPQNSIKLQSKEE